MKVSQWTIDNMQDETGYFYYRRYSRWLVNKTPTLHWGRARCFAPSRAFYRSLEMKKESVKSVLIVVENLPVPFDSRVWKEARALQNAGYDVSVLSPRGKGYRRNHEVLEGVHIYRHPMPKEGNTPLGYLWEYSCAFFWECFLYSWWIFLTRGFQVMQCNPPDNIFLVVHFKLFGVKYIFDHHDANPELYLSKYERKDAFYKVQVWLESLTYRFSDVVIATNQSYKSLAISRGGRNPRDVFVVGTALIWKASGLFHRKLPLSMENPFLSAMSEP